MADPLVSFLIDNLSRLLTHEANLLLGVKDEVHSLNNEVKLIHAYIKTFESSSPKDAAQEEFLNQIRCLVHEAEDAVDHYVATDIRQRHGGGDWLERTKLRFLQLIAGHSVAENIVSIRDRFNKLYESRDKFRIQDPQQKSHENDLSGAGTKRNSSLDSDGADARVVVGFEKEAEAIIGQLTRGQVERDVIPIEGMAGIGKTTLAWRVYNDPAIVNCFDYRAWVVLSRDYSVRELLEAITKSVMLLTDEMKRLTDKELGLELRGYLRSARYLIVLDDVWEIKHWEDISMYFPFNLLRSRIILTTRKKEVALSTKPSNPPHSLTFLSDAESWNLLCIKVFGKRICPDPDLENSGRQIAKGCGGLPLAIVVIAGVLLKKEKTTRWWSKVSSRVSAFINEHTARCSEIFSWSYEDLPDHLRSCFLYIGLFPEHEILAKQLTRLWLAEGFIPAKDRMLPEDVADDFLEELIDRNLLQVSRKKFDGSVKSCRVHDLLREFCITKAKNKKFLEVYRYSQSSTPCSSRRLGIHSSPLSYLSSNRPASNLRSLLCFGHDEERLSSKHLKMLYKGHMLLRVLDLWDVDVDTIPSEIEKLICLRYLRLKSDSAKTFPQSICNLWNLQILEVIAPLIERPQINIWKMRQLRHFYFNGEVVLSELPRRAIKEYDYCLTYLQTLSRLSPDSCTEIALSQMPNLLKLGIHGDLETHKDLAFKNISRLCHLVKLKLVKNSYNKSVTKIPTGAKFPSTLVRLTLSKTELVEDPMYLLGKTLHNLKVLKLKDAAYAGSKLECLDCGFPQLEVLKLVNLSITRWQISKGSMPKLKIVVINRCGRLVDLPAALQHVSTFRELQLWYPNSSVSKCARDIETHKGKDEFKLLMFHADNRE